MKNILTLVLLLTSFCFVTAQTTLIPYKATWNYLDDGSDQGTAWTATTFDDAAWKSGPAELGYGDGDEATEVSYGPNKNYKYITTYFRKTITISDPAHYTSYSFKLLRDDGAVVYVNGTEVYRNNMHSGEVSYTTRASSSADDDGNTARSFTAPASAFVAGTNVIAVEIHQVSSSSSDISFDLRLIGTSSTTLPPPPPPTSGSADLTRGPYLQMVNQSAATLRWRTDVATDSKIEVGTTLDNYTLSATNANATTEHEVRITGLSPNTKYYYRFGSSSQELQGGSANYFTTAPLATTTQKIRIAAFGDCGVGGSVQQAVLEAYLDYSGSNPATLMLLLGDNAYSDGTDDEYQNKFFEPYSGTVLKNHALFSVPGNHDYHTTSKTSRSAPYYKVFSLPTDGECGGLASGTEAFYSWDWGPVHFLALDSYGEEADATRLYDTLGPQVTWIKKDLEANNSKWTIAYWHHPPYTMGTHNSDSEGELARIRQNFIRILERYGVDLVLCGHSHDYERSYLLQGYYGSESSFDLSTDAVTSSSGKYNGSTNSCPFTTRSGKYDHGIVYVVSGSSARSGADVQSSFPHKALPFATNDGGMFLIDVEDNRLDAKMIHESGAVFDQFTILKDVNKTSNLTLSLNQPLTLTASWEGTYQWSNGATTRSITVSPSINTTYSVEDNQGCLKDVFNISLPVTTAASNFRDAGDRAAVVGVFPTLVTRGQVVTARTDQNKQTEAVLVDNNGRRIRTFKFSGMSPIETKDLSAGTYYLIMQAGGKLNRQRFIVTN